MKNLYYLRHGLSEANKSGYWGSGKSPLLEEGKAQAIKAGILAKKAGQSFDVIYASPLVRALQTAKYFAKEIGYPEEKIVVDNKLVERGFGVLEENYNNTATDGYMKDEAFVDTYAGVEKLADLQKRADGVLEILQKRPEENILIVGHGAFGRALKRSINKLPITERGAILQNATLYKYI